MRTEADYDRMVETIREVYTPDPLCDKCGSQVIVRCKCGENKSCECGYTLEIIPCFCITPSSPYAGAMWTNFHEK